MAVLNYWWVTRPKRKLNSIPEVLAAFSNVALSVRWSASRNVHILFEEELEKLTEKKRPLLAKNKLEDDEFSFKLLVGDKTNVFEVLSSLHSLIKRQKIQSICHGICQHATRLNRVQATAPSNCIAWLIMMYKQILFFSLSVLFYTLTIAVYYINFFPPLYKVSNS